MGAAAASVARLRGVLAEHFEFDRPRNVASACVAMVLLCGLVSLALGQDRNWDLRNYHLYNAYAWLNDRLGHDLAAAQLQSYFTPLLDVPYFWMATRWAASSAGFVLGAFHGLAFAGAAAVAWRALEGQPRRSRLAPLLALAGCAGAAFLSGLGNTMGDNATAVPVLAAIFLLLPQSGADRANPLPRILLAGILLGAAVGLKLTNAPYAVGMGVAVMAFPPTRMSRLKAVVLLAGGTVASFLVVAGPWFWSVWETFGNPLFPQFNAGFRAPLAQPISVADSKWGPQGWGEALAWPLLFTIDPDRVSNSPLPQLIWAVLYPVGLCWLGWLLWRRWRGPSSSPASVASPALGFLLVFVPVSFVAWMLVFGIYRYLVVLELLAPLLLWLGLKPVFPRAARYVVLGCVSVSLLGWNTWGHAGWGERGFSVQTPKLQGPADTTTVAMVGGAPMAWMVAFLPGEFAFVSLASNFPESPGYVARVREMMGDRGGDNYAIIPAAVDKRVARMKQIDSILASLGMSGGAGDCGILHWLVERTGFDAQVAPMAADGDDACRLEVPTARRLDVGAENLALANNADQAVRTYGIRLDVEGCRVYEAYIGDDALPYQWCPLELTGPP